MKADGTSAAANSNVSRGGFVGIGKSCLKFEFNSCLNAGDVLKGNTDSGGTSNYESAGGFIGLQRYAGFGGVGGKNGLTKFVNCINTGNVEGVNSASGFIGKNFEIKNGANNDDSTYKFEAKFEGCLNTGDITAPFAGGFFGITTNTVYGGANIELTATECANAGNINGKNAAGGIIGYWNYGVAVIDNCVNSGNITSTAAAAGIVGNNERGTVMHGETAYTVSITVKNSINMGAVECMSDNINPVGCGEYTYENNFYCKDILDDWFDEADPMDLEESMDALTEKNIVACFFANVIEEIGASAALIADKTKYEAISFAAYEAAIETAGKLIDTPYVRAEDGALEIISQESVNTAYKTLAAAKAALKLVENDQPAEPNEPNEQPNEPNEPNEPAEPDVPNEPETTEPEGVEDPSEAPTSAPTDSVEEREAPKAKGESEVSTTSTPPSTALSTVMAAMPEVSCV